MHRVVACLLLSLPVPALAADLAGLWVGFYAYAPETGNEPVECAMALEHIADNVGGVMVEPQTFGEEIDPGMPAEMLGVLDGTNLLLEKYYYSQGEDAPPVTYRLSLSPDGNTLNGFWSIGELHGTASFRRVTAESANRIPNPR